MAKKQKKEEKEQRRLRKKDAQAGENPAAEGGTPSHQVGGGGALPEGQGDAQAANPEQASDEEGAAA